MRAYVVLFVIGTTVAVTGCMHNQLRQSTVYQASTLTDLQQKQVLDNLAMISCNPEALPWHSKLTGGLVQVADQGNAGLMAEIPFGVGAKLMPGLAAQRGLLEQWSVEPTIAADDLELLYLAYRKATDPSNASVNEEIYKAICELSLRFDILPSEKILAAILVKKDAAGKVAEQVNEIKKLLKDEPQTKWQVSALKKRGERKTSDEANLSMAYQEYSTLKAVVSKKDILQDLIDEVPVVRQVAETKMVNGQAQTTYRTVVSRPAGYLGRTDDRKQEILTALEWLCEPSAYLPKGTDHQPAKRNPGLVDQAADKIKKLQDLLMEAQFQEPWLCRGCKKDMPACACYVGRYCGCEGECYVWVMPDQAKTLREFTLIILTLAPKESQDMTPAGAAFSPSFR